MTLYTETLNTPVTLRDTPVLGGETPVPGPRQPPHRSFGAGTSPILGTGFNLNFPTLPHAAPADTLALC